MSDETTEIWRVFSRHNAMYIGTASVIQNMSQRMTDNTAQSRTQRRQAYDRSVRVGVRAKFIAQNYDKHRTSLVE